MKRIIKKVAVLGSGVMGSRIACHFANAGIEVLLLDIVPKDAPADDKKARNKIVNDALQFALKSNPSPIYSKSFVTRITTGNFEDNLPEIAGCDWVIEVIIERLDIKQSLFERVEQYRKPGTLVSSNTSGIPIHLMAEGRSEDFRAHFCGTPAPLPEIIGDHTHRPHLAGSNGLPDGLRGKNAGKDHGIM